MISAETLRACVQSVADGLAWLKDSPETCEQYIQENEGFVKSIIGFLEVALADARYLHNYRLPVTKLPPEILSNIFKLLEDRNRPIRPSGSSILRSTSTLKWTRVMCVCKYWRWTALETPSLWSLIQIKPLTGVISRAPDLLQRQNVAFASTSLQRSGSGPLIARLHFDAATMFMGRYEAFMPALFNELHRITELRLSLISGDSCDAQMLHGLEAGAPQLQILMVHVGFDNSRLAEEEYREDWDPLRSLFIGTQCPHLRVLSVERYYGWLSGSLQHLCHLFVGCLSFDARTATEFHAVVAANVQLESLVLYNIEVTAGPEVADLHDLGKLHLKNLQKVAVSDSDKTVYYLLHHWLQPSKTRALQYSCPGHDSDFDWQDIFHADDTFTAKHVYFGLAKIVGRTERSAFCLQGGEGLKNLVQHAVSRHTLSGITILKHCSPSLEEWIGLFVELPQITSLGFVAGAPRWLSTLGDTPHLLPALRELHIHNPNHVDGIPIFSFLRRRSRSGHSLDTLRVSASRMIRGGAGETWQRKPNKLLQLVKYVCFSEGAAMVLPKVCLGEGCTEAFWDRDAWFSE